MKFNKLFEALSTTEQKVVKFNFEILQVLMIYLTEVVL